MMLMSPLSTASRGGPVVDDGESGRDVRTTHTNQSRALLHRRASYCGAVEVKLGPNKSAFGVRAVSMRQIAAGKGGSRRDCVGGRKSVKHSKSPSLGDALPPRRTSDFRLAPPKGAGRCCIWFSRSTLQRYAEREGLKFWAIVSVRITDGPAAFAPLVSASFRLRGVAA
jgi:hypothetical protein